MSEFSKKYGNIIGSETYENGLYAQDGSGGASTGPTINLTASRPLSSDDNGNYSHEIVSNVKCKGDLK